jgi:hypothetical protein
MKEGHARVTAIEAAPSVVFDGWDHERNHNESS